MTDSPFLVGLDLGTSNCAVASVEPRHGPDAPLTDLPIPQLQRLGAVGSQPLLPSCLYVPGEHELPREATTLPWTARSELVLGEFARWQGARVPGRLVASAKSWLCHPGVDRTAPILPWSALSEVKRISPVEASALLLRHLSEAWNQAHREAPLAEQEVIITVPASFDEVARSLTVAAAKQAGLETFTLLEEPQAAFYDFTARHRHDLGTALEGVRLVLVVDVGGGTSDFTLVQVGVSPEGPVLRRIAVGEHLILGGDNMDAALARRAEERLVAGGRKLSPAQWSQLTQLARIAKETLLSEGGPDQYPLTVLAEGSRLLGGSLSTQLRRDEAEDLVLDGFFPKCKAAVLPERSTRVALQEIGLPYASDPAITRHLAGFLRRHAAAGFNALGQEPVPGQLPRPDALLLNGGVFNSAKIAGRLRAVLSSWWPEAPSVAWLEHTSLELAVARGAAYYGLVRRGLGRRITGGAAHALYVGLEKAGQESPLALCVVPRGQEEGIQVDLGDRVFQLMLGRPVRFPLYSTSSDRLEQAGDVVPWTEDLSPLPPIHTVLKSARAEAGSVPVHLRSALTEIGTLELWCVSDRSNEQWRLEFELRGDAGPESLTMTESMPPRFSDAREAVERVFGGKPVAGRTATDAKVALGKEIKALWSALERTLGPREEWRVPVLRELWSVLFAGAARRRRSVDHERIFFQLLGFSLRPGFGYPLDEWRCEQCARLFSEGVQSVKEKPVWTEFWVLWRRLAGGMSEGRQEEIWALLKPHLAHRVAPNVPKHLARPKGVQPEGLEEMVRLAASLEHLPSAEKQLLGDWIAARLSAAPGEGPWTWALGRLGARTPLYGSAHRLVSPGAAAAWVELLLDPKLSGMDGTLFALAQVARRTGDRARDLEDPLRERVERTLREAAAPASWVRMVSEVAALEAVDKARALGDTLPVGLQLR